MPYCISDTDATGSAGSTGYAIYMWFYCVFNAVTKYYHSTTISLYYLIFQAFNLESLPLSLYKML